MSKGVLNVHYFCLGTLFKTKSDLANFYRGKNPKIREYDVKTIFTLQKLQYRPNFFRRDSAQNECRIGKRLRNFKRKLGARTLQY